MFHFHYKLGTVLVVCLSCLVTICFALALCMLSKLLLLHSILVFLQRFNYICVMCIHSQNLYVYPWCILPKNLFYLCTNHEIMLQFYIDIFYLLM